MDKFWSVLLFISILWIGYCQARSRRNHPVCNEIQNNKMNEEFQECLKKFTEEHHESTGKASSPEEYQVSILAPLPLARFFD